MRIREIFNLSGSAMRAQSTRMRVIAENVANAETIDDGKGVPYQRKLTILQAKPAAGKAFDDVLKATYREAARAVSGVEEANRQVALGVADVDAVATTVADAEIMLETLVTIRDKLVTAYNDLVRTPV